MVIARVLGEELQLIDRLREGVRLAAYLDERRRLTAEGERRALDCLQKFGQRIRHLSPGCVRAVGTNTLRKARKTRRFLEHARLALGHPIEVVSGQEEARLIYLGAAHSLAGGDNRRLVLDIGGGSTELALGQGFEPQVTESLYMGCVGYSLKHFPEGKIKPSYMRRAETAARLELEPVKAAFFGERLGGDGGHLGHLARSASAGARERLERTGITRESLLRLREVVLAARHVDELELPGLKRDRARVLPGGLAILQAVFDTFAIERIDVASGAMREGVLYDLIGRIRHEDMRERTHRQLNPEASPLVSELGGASARDRLGGGHGGYQKHGAYLVENSDMPGFSLQDQRVLSLLILGHRRKLHRDLFEGRLPSGRAERAFHLGLIFRLAVLLNRSRDPQPLPPGAALEARPQEPRIACCRRAGSKLVP
nr:exopolyphosphatase-like [Nerophis lumbriciformis]